MKQEPTKEDVRMYDSALHQIADTFTDSLGFAVDKNVMQACHGVAYLRFALEIIKMRVTCRKSYPQFFTDEDGCACGRVHGDDDAEKAKHNTPLTMPDGADFSITDLRKFLDGGA